MNYIQKFDGRYSTKRNPAKKISKRSFSKSFLNSVPFPFLILFFLLILPLNLKSQLVNTSVTKEILTIETLPDLEKARELSLVQKNKTADLYFNTGISFPTLPDVFSDYWSPGFNLGGGADYYFSKSFSIGGSLDYNSFPFDEDGFLKSYGFSGTGITIDGGTASIFTFTANGKGYLTISPGSVSIYSSVALGYFNLSLSDVDVRFQGQLFDNVEGDSESGFSFLFGFGIEIPAGSVSIFLEGNYGTLYTKADFTYYIPVKAGVKFGL